LNPRTVLVTGAQGFIGRHAARAFARSGAEVVGLGRHVWPVAEAREWGIGRWQQAAVSVPALEALHIVPDVIVHCAGGGSVGFARSNPLEDFECSVAATASVLEFARRTGSTAKVLFPSSAAVYGHAAKLPIPEASPLSPVSVYGAHKVMAEECCRSWSRHFGVSVAIVRLFSAYGPELRKQLLWDACLKLRAGDRTFAGRGDETRDWLHVEDVAELFVRAVDRASPDAPTVNGGSGEAVTVRKILRHVFRSWGEAGDPVFTGETRPGDPKDYQADISQVSTWGWAPQRKLKAGIAGYVDWFRSVAR